MSDDNSMENALMEENWEKEGDKHYCEDCYSFDDEANLVLKEISTTN